MTFTGTPIEVMALILIIVGAIKLVIVVVNPKIWLNSVVKKVWARPALTMVVSLVLAGTSLYYLTLELSIVQILAVMLFTALLVAVGITTYSKEVIAVAEKLLKGKSILKRSALYIIIWIILLIWGLYTLFA